MPFSTGKHVDGEIDEGTRNTVYMVSTWMHVCYLFIIICLILIAYTMSGLDCQTYCYWAM